jgi:putative ABC transport system permease protein
MTKSDNRLDGVPGTSLGNVLREFRFALRGLVKARSVTWLAIVILGVGIGSTAAALNVALGVLATPLPVRDDSRLLILSKHLPGSTTKVPYSTAEIAAWRQATQTLQNAAGFQYDGAWPYPAQIDGRDSVVAGALISGEFFDVLGVMPAMGRLVRPDDARAGSEPVCVIGHGLWQREFGGDRAAVGRRLRLYGQPVTIIGVAPPGFAFPQGVDVWRPLRITPTLLNAGAFGLVGRLKPDASVAQVSREAEVLLQRLRDVMPPGVQRDVQVSAVPLRDAVVAQARPVLLLFVAAAILVFVVGCINVTMLLMARGSARGHEMAVRSALGATQWLLVRQLAVEGACLAAAAGVVGTVVAFWLQRTLVLLAPDTLPRLEQVGFDARAVSLIGLVSLISIFPAGVAPSLFPAYGGVALRLRGAATERGQARPVISQLLVGTQLAFALLVTMSAGLLVESLAQLQAVKLGFSADGLTGVSVPLVGAQYGDIEHRRRFFDELVTRVEALPNIVAATPVLLEPFTGVNGWDSSITAEGQNTEEAAANPGLHMETAFPNYFTTMKIPLRQGRPFTDADREGALPVVIVSDSLAHRLWPGEMVIGKRIKRGPPTGPEPWLTIVGLVGDLHYRDLMAPPPAIYLPLRQTWFPPRVLMVRTTDPNVPVLELVSRIVKSIDADEPIPKAFPLSSLLAHELSGPRFFMLGLALFAAVVLVMAGVGVFGVLATFVGQQSRELGIRAALGATKHDLRRIVLFTLSWPALVGLVLGSVLAPVAGRLVGPLLFNVSTAAPSALVAGWIVLGLTTLLAALVPLRRAVRVDPVTLLRSE